MIRVPLCSLCEGAVSCLSAALLEDAWTSADHARKETSAERTSEDVRLSVALLLKKDSVVRRYCDEVFAVFIHSTGF
jgi:hypothetical protein